MKVVVLDDYQGVALAMADWSPVTAVAEVEVVREHVPAGPQLVARLQGAQVVVAMRERTPLDAALLEQLPDLRLIVTTGPSNAVIDVAAAHQRGVTVCGTGGFIEPTVELTWALILGIVKNLPEEVASVRQGGWQQGVGGDLHGRRLGVVGLGRIGSRVARVGAAFGMEVVAWSQNLTRDRAEAAGVTLVPKEELFATADIVTVHLVLSERTRGVVDRASLQAMKPTAYLVNTSRGPLVDEQALVELLDTGSMAGAALDVFGAEPLPAGHPLRTQPRVLATPHVGYVTTGVYELFFREIVEDIDAFVRGSPIRQVTG